VPFVGSISDAEIEALRKKGYEGDLVEAIDDVTIRIRGDDAFATLSIAGSLDMEPLWVSRQGRR
jgi:hypothetical protein